MKKNTKIIILIYLGVAVFTYALSLRIEHLEVRGNTQRKNQSIVLKMK